MLNVPQSDDFYPSSFECYQKMNVQFCVNTFCFFRNLGIV